jgi:hypothetical protein
MAQNNNDGPTEAGYKAGIEIGPDGEPTGNIVCYPSFNPNCIVVRTPKVGAVTSTGFLSLPEPTPFHDETLINASVKINEILAKIENRGESRKGHLHVILANDGPMLVWVRTTAMPMDDVTKSSATKMH